LIVSATPSMSFVFVFLLPLPLLAVALYLLGCHIGLHKNAGRIEQDL
jgi:hypothetical protein